jgi:hypothetical protein
MAYTNSNPFCFGYGNAGLQKPFALYIVKEVEIWDNESDRVSRDRNVRNIVPGDHIGGVVVYNEEKDRWEYDTLTIG